MAYPYSNETKQPVTGTIPTTGCLKGVLIPVLKSGVSPSLDSRAFCLRYELFDKKN